MVDRNRRTIAVVKRLAMLALTGSIVASCATVEMKRTGDEIAVTIDQKPFTTFYFSQSVAKPYLMPLRTASGTIVTRRYPVGNDVGGVDPKTASFEPHQRPLYFAHGNV